MLNKENEYNKSWRIRNKERCRVYYLRYIHKDNNRCLDCGKHITKRATRCGSCNKKRIRGSDSHAWKGGVSPLRRYIRRLRENDEWVRAVMERDGFVCKKCGFRGKLHVHHIKPFAMLITTFLREYNQFSPIEDIETLGRIAINYKPFWDTDNGITLCPECHKLERARK